MTNQEAYKKVVELWPSDMNKRGYNWSKYELRIDINEDGDDFLIIEYGNPDYGENDVIIGSGTSWEEAFETALKSPYLNKD